MTITITDEKKRELRKAAIVFAYVALFVVSIAAMTIYFSTDFIRPLVTEFKENFGWTTAQVNLLSSIYSVPPVIFLFFSGILTDKWGIRKSTIFLMGLIAVGGVLIAFLGYWWILAGRLLIGLGAEGFFVVMNKIVTKWFKDKQLAMAFGLNLFLCRLGSIAAFYVLPWLAQAYTMKIVVLVGAGITLAGFLLAMLYCLVDKKGDEKGYAAPEADDDEEPFKVSDVLRLPAAFWVITMLCVTYYSAIFPFTGVAKDFFVEKDKKILVADLEKEGFTNELGYKLFQLVSGKFALTGKANAQEAADGLVLFESLNIGAEQSGNFPLEIEFLDNGTLRKETIDWPVVEKLQDEAKDAMELPGVLAESLVKLIPDQNALATRESAQAVADELNARKVCDTVTLQFDETHAAYALELEYEVDGGVEKSLVTKRFLRKPAFEKMPEELKKKLPELLDNDEALKSKASAEKIAETIQAIDSCRSAAVTIDEDNSFYALQMNFTANGESRQKTLDWNYLTESSVYKKYEEAKLSGGRLTTLILWISMLVTWAFGLLIDKIGKRATMMIIGSIAMIPCHVTMAYTNIPEFIPMMVLGLSFALVPAALWPAVPLIVKEKMLGTAFAIIFLVQNIGLAAFEPIAGHLFDVTGDYKMTMVMFSCLGVVGLVFALWLKYLEKKGGGYLDTAKAKVL